MLYLFIYLVFIKQSRTVSNFTVLKKCVPIWDSSSSSECTTMWSTRMVNQCTLEVELRFSSTIRPSHHGSGKLLAIMINTTYLTFSRFYPWLPTLALLKVLWWYQLVFRYDRKDPTSVAVSISPEASLMLGKSQWLWVAVHQHQTITDSDCHYQWCWC